MNQFNYFYDKNPLKEYIEVVYLNKALVIKVKSNKPVSTTRFITDNAWDTNFFKINTINFDLAEIQVSSINCGFVTEFIFNLKDYYDREIKEDDYLHVELVGHYFYKNYKIKKLDNEFKDKFTL